MNNIKRVLITGGSGFIGTHLTRHLLQIGGYDITIVDVMVPKIEGVKFVQAEIGDLTKLQPYLAGADVVVHLAAMVGVDNCRNHPEKVEQINSTETKQLIDFCVDQGVKRFIFSSSSEIYGNSIDIPYREDGVPEPISLYAKCKLEIEKYLKLKSNQMSVGIVRFFNVYGPGQKDSFVVSIFVKAALSNEPISIFGDGEQTRCFTYVGDAVDGVARLMEYDKTPYEIVNIGNSTEVSVREVADIVLASVPDTKSVIEHKHYNGADVREVALEINRRVPSVDKARELLGFEAKTPLNSGIDLIVKNYETVSRQPVPAGN